MPKKQGPDPFTTAAIIAWLISVLLVLAFWGVITWGVIELVQWVTSK